MLVRECAVFFRQNFVVYKLKVPTRFLFFVKTIIIFKKLGISEVCFQRKKAASATDIWNYCTVPVMVLWCCSLSVFIRSVTALNGVASIVEPFKDTVQYSTVVLLLMQCLRFGVRYPFDSVLVAARSSGSLHITHSLQCETWNIMNGWNERVHDGDGMVRSGEGLFCGKRSIREQRIMSFFLYIVQSCTLLLL